MTQTTEEKLQAHLASAERYWCAGRFRRTTVRAVVCADGTTLSVQASSTHYCSPRDDDGPWSAVEIGFPSRKLEALMPFAQDYNDPTDTIYCNVPMTVLAAVVDECGGFAEDMKL